MYRKILAALLAASLSGFAGQWQQYNGGQTTETAQAYPQPQYQQPQYPQSQYPAAAPDQQQADVPNSDDAQHGVARLSIVQGDVNLRRGDNGQLTVAVINAPVVSRDHLETSPGSRAEVELDAGNILRLGPNTDASFANLQYRQAQIQLALGTIIYRVISMSQSQVEIDTPSIGIRALAPGEYRISVFDNGTSQITVRSGQLELSAPRGAERIDAGRTVMIRGDASDPEMQTSNAIPPDQLDQWSQDRDRETAPQQSGQYVGADVQGTADLDRNGNWVTSGYGQVWQPQGVATDWSPYSDGQWSYLDYYGWTWVDAAPWGWAPYHYGRWFWNTGYGWCWWPGAHRGYSYWSPALVGFFGFGVGVRGLGWVALAPFELFHPWWGRSGYGYGGGYSLASFRNAGIRGGALTATFTSFSGQRQRFAAATRSQLAGAAGFGGRLPVSPNAQSYRFSARTPVANQRLAAGQNRTFYRASSTFRVPNASARQNFSAPATSSPRAQYPSTGSSSGWQHFGSPAPNSTFRQNFSQGSDQSAWHSFGQPPTVNRPNYSAPRSTYNYSAPRYTAPVSPRYSAPAQPHYNAPAQPHYSQPAQPHYSAPSGGGGSKPSGGGGHSGGGGGHSSGGGGHRGR